VTQRPNFADAGLTLFIRSGEFWFALSEQGKSRPRYQMNNGPMTGAIFTREGHDSLGMAS
jgi:hypothetical protein